MGEALLTRGDQPGPNEHRQTLAGLLADLAVVGQRGVGKSKRVSRSAPMYRPSRHPVGKGFKVIDRLNPGSARSVDYREVLPHRSVSAGVEGSFEAPPLYACSVSRGTLITDGVLFHGVLAENDLLVSEVSADFRSRNGDWPSFRRLQRFPPRVTVGSGVSLLTGGGGLSNYGHWLYDVLPRLHLLRLAGFVTPDARYLLPPIDTEFKRTSLDRLGIDPSKCIEISGPVSIAGDTIAASSGHRSHGRVEPWVPEFLRDALLLGATPQTGLRLYVNRRDTKIRRVLNEAALESALAARGFRSISAADYDFQKKIDLYRAAEIIVAPHGSGLANIAFCSPGTHIVEIDGQDWSDPWFGDVARAMDLRYMSTRAFRTVSPAWLPGIVRHLEVDVEQVLDTVDCILA
jgi:capsular polysaccharide biosynthesis protein